VLVEGLWAPHFCYFVLLASELLTTEPIITKEVELLIFACNRYIISLGCLVVICSLPLSLFFQQTVTYLERYVPAGVNGTLPSVITYGNSEMLFELNGTLSASGDILLESAVDPFLYGKGTRLAEQRNRCSVKPDHPSTCSCLWILSQCDRESTFFDDRV
jgi:hypothetical protein